MKIKIDDSNKELLKAMATMTIGSAIIIGLGLLSISRERRRTDKKINPKVIRHTTQTRSVPTALFQQYTR